jgi:hypothetical protein
MGSVVVNVILAAIALLIRKAIQSSLDELFDRLKEHVRKEPDGTVEGRVAFSLDPDVKEQIGLDLLDMGFGAKVVRPLFAKKGEAA